MSGQWSLISLKKYFDVRLASMETAVTKAETSHEKRLEGMNEFRAQLGDQSKTFLTRAEYDIKHELICQKIEALQKLVFIGVGIIGIAEVILVIFLIHLSK